MDEPPDELFDDRHGHTAYLASYILSSEENPQQPLRLIYVCHDES
jgi:hypothetical protein